MAKRRNSQDLERRREAADLCAGAAPDISVSQVARRYDATANFVFKWLRDPRFAPKQAAEEKPRFLPVELVGEGEKERPAARCVESRIEIDLAGGRSLRISGAYDPDVLVRLIHASTRDPSGPRAGAGLSPHLLEPNSCSI